MADEIIILPGAGDIIDDMGQGSSGKSHWGIVPGAHRCGSDSDPSNGKAEATAFAEVSGLGSVKRWATVGTVVEASAPSYSNEDVIGGTISVHGDLKGEVMGFVDATGTVDVYLHAYDLSNNNQSTAHIAHHEGFVLSIVTFDHLLQGDVHMTFYDGHLYLFEVEVMAEAFIAGPYGGASGDAGPFDGDGGDGVSVDRFLIEYDEHDDG